MRPWMSRKLTKANAVKLVRGLLADYVVQPKLNGDRVLLVKRNGIVEAWNRHGSRYSFSVNAMADWGGLPDGTILDGEGWQGRFYPFEAVIDDAPVEARVEAARRYCLELGNAFIFDTPTDAFLRNGADNLPQWEGVVAKKRGSIYRWNRKAHFESIDWLKLKW